MPRENPHEGYLPYPKLITQNLVIGGQAVKETI